MKISNKAKVCELCGVNVFLHSSIRVINDLVSAGARACCPNPGARTAESACSQSASNSKHFRQPVFARTWLSALLFHLGNTPTRRRTRANRTQNPPSCVGGCSLRAQVAPELGRWLSALLTGSILFSAVAQETDSPARTNSAPPRIGSAPPGIDESAFGIVTERNIFNANRSGGQVRLASRRARIETFTLVGTMAYEKGAFAFFEGSSSEFTKVLKADGVIAGHKLVDIYADSVKLEADAKQIELPMGSQMRREDAGAWQLASGGGSGAVNGESSYTPGRSGDSSSRYNRSRRGDDSSRRRREGESSNSRAESSESAIRSSTNTSNPNADQNEILKRLMERREKESP